MARARLQWRGEAFERARAAELERAMGAVAAAGEAELKVILSTPGAGREYPRGKTVTHKASAPGDPPAPDTGRLRASVSHEVVRSGADIIARVSDNTQYALALELGTEKIAPRPALRPLLPRLARAALAIIRARL
jgi:hypothetical protein